MGEAGGANAAASRSARTHAGLISSYFDLGLPPAPDRQLSLPMCMDRGFSFDAGRITKRILSKVLDTVTR
jgi:hypothetical protein